MNDETNLQPAGDAKGPVSADNDPVNRIADEEPEIGGRSWRETFRMALERAREQQRRREGRHELGRDRTKGLVVLVALVAVLVLLFFGLFSRPSTSRHLAGENPHGQPNLGQRVTPGQTSRDSGKTVTPILSADVRPNDASVEGQVTPEDIDRTSRTGHLAKPSPAREATSAPQDYALSRVDFSDPLAGKPGNPPASRAAQVPAQSPESELRRPSLVFVRAEANAALKRFVPEPEEGTLALPAGTRLLARLEAPVSSAVVAPVVAVVEYNYEHDGQIVMPAGARVLGRLVEASPTGDVAIQFNRVELPDGSSGRLGASAMGLNFKPLKGYVAGKKTGTKLLVRSLTGLGTVASYLVGPQASGSAGLISTNVLMRERLAENLATASQEELGKLAFNQSLVVTVPGNTRFYVVLEKPASDESSGGSGARNPSLRNASLNGAPPTLEELRQLIELRREINELYTPGNGEAGVEPKMQ